MTGPRYRAPAPAFRTGIGNPPTPADVGWPAGDLPPTFGTGQQVPVSTVITFPWWERPTLGSLDQQPLVQGIVLPALGTVNLATFTVPQGYLAVLRGVNIFALNTTVLFNVQYNVLYNGSPLFQQPLQTFGRVAASVEVPFSFAKRVTGGGDLLVTASDPGGTGPWTVGAQLFGWITPESDADRAMG